ncbi:MAG: hypothetical protein AVDCRST_MAG45-1499 [uncultured Solirubrobacterales bacterium]|uniref:Uncharacterized protein n=1 Tax=uncultured Solirubrobacterales bacterium TaxID=768556 RepID=A0A6J4SSQ4_9ACTN|nr:MAG: hypothetical protein AVDCRST_MAG45-1499 [uncultured Solirubrobacterales bacterium]
MGTDDQGRAAGSTAESLDRVRTRVSEAPLRHGNRVTLLQNGSQAYEEWLAEIGLAGRLGPPRELHLQGRRDRAPVRRGPEGEGG